MDVSMLDICTVDTDWQGSPLRPFHMHNLICLRETVHAENLCSCGMALTGFNPRRACAARVTVLGLSSGRTSLSVRPSVRPSVTTFSPATRNKTAKKRYQRVQCHTGFI